MQMTTSRRYSPQKTCVLLHLGTQIGKPRKTLSSEAERNNEKKVHHARCSDSPSRGCTQSKNICLWYEACTQMGQQAPCSARMNKNCKISSVHHARCSDSASRGCTRSARDSMLFSKVFIFFSFSFFSFKVFKAMEKSGYLSTAAIAHTIFIHHGNW